MQDIALTPRLRRIAAIRGWTLDGILADPGNVDLFDREEIEYYRLHRILLEPGLVRNAIEANGGVRLASGILLLEMGAASGGPLVLQSLADPDPTVVWRALSFLSGNRTYRQDQQPLPLELWATADALRPFLAAADPRLREAAASALCRLPGVELLHELRQALGHDDHEVRRLVAIHLALQHGDAAAWPLLRSLFVSPTLRDRFWIETSLSGFATNPDNDLKLEIARLVFQRLELFCGHPEIDASIETSRLLDVLAALAPDWQRVALCTIVSSKLSRRVRTDALRRMLKHEEPSSSERWLMALFEDPEMVDDLYDVIRQMGASACTPAIIDRLRNDLRDAKTDQRVDKIVSAFIAIGLGYDSELGHVLDRVDDLQRFDIVTRRDGISAEAMIEQLDHAGLLVLARDDALQRFRGNWFGFGRYFAILGVLQGTKRFCDFSCKDFHGWSKYTELFSDLLIMDDQEIEPGEIIYPDKPGEIFHVSLTIAGQPTLFELKYYHRWFDIDGVLKGLNRSLAERHSRLRYHELRPLDDWTCVVLADAAAMQSMISTLAFPVETKFNA